MIEQYTVVQEIYGGEYHGAYAGNTCVGNWPPIPPGWGQLLIPKSEWAYLCQGVLYYEYVVPRFGGTGCMLSRGSSEGYLASSPNEHAHSICSSGAYIAEYATLTFRVYTVSLPAR